MSLTARVLIGLGAGLATGLALSLTGSPALARVAGVLEPVGIVFTNAIRMTVIPLVTSSLVVGIASSTDARSVGRLGGRAVVAFLAMVTAAAGFAAVVAAPVLAALPVDPQVVAALQQGASSTEFPPAGGLRTVPTLGTWLRDLVPVNPVQAAAEGAMLPLIVFTVAFALALGRLEGKTREAVLAVSEGVLRASLVLVNWVLALAPFGVFALAVPLAARMGVAALGTLASYVLLVAALNVAFALGVLYPVAAVAGVGLRRFARAAAPAQAVALSTRSSLAALPAMIEAARRLSLPAEVSGVLVPLAVSVFRAGSAIGQIVGVLFLARLYGVTLATSDLATITLTVVVATFSIPGVPGGSVLAVVPTLLAANVPVQGIGILLGVDTIPDMFRTAANVTGGLSAAVLLGRGSNRHGGSSGQSGGVPESEGRPFERSSPAHPA
ncbi:MAG TPA: dicarboxylate/amino acid:cation symporter [Vicinamibacteria bacterium]|nr:dicarboxylate/amino acid:cation symporter [Vicinamibacteria bacterium]